MTNFYKPMQFEKEILQKAADKGAKKVAEAFSKLSGSSATVEISKVEIVPVGEATERIKRPTEQAIVTYGQLLSGISGVSLLIISRESALVLVDLLNQQPVGTTGILKDIDRSAIKETLNILSNSYMTALAEESGIDLGMGVPGMITAERIDDIIAAVVKKGAKAEDSAVIFETMLVITNHKVRASLYLLFNERLIEVMKK